MDKLHTISIVIDDNPPFTLEVVPGAKILITTTPDGDPAISVEPGDSFGNLDDPDSTLE